MSKPSQPSFDPAGQIIIVTGAASGIGDALCRRFAALGAKAIVCCDLNLEGCVKLCEDIQKTGASTKVFPRKVNAASEDAICRLIDETEMFVGPVDLFCSNAGIGVQLEGDSLAGLVDVKQSQWDLIMGVNVYQATYAAKYLAPKFLERKKGHFLITASAAGLLTQIGSLSYAVTKAAAVSVAEWLSITYGPTIGVNCLCPQAVETAMTAGGPGVAGVDGMITADECAQSVTDAMKEGHFLVLPHKSVSTYVVRKAGDRDRWLVGMQRLQARMLPVPKL